MDDRAAVTTSYPFLTVARRWNVPYTLVLQYADYLQTGSEAQDYRAESFIKGSGASIMDKWAADTRAAVYHEARRRAQQ